MLAVAIVPLLAPAAASADTVCSYNAPTQTLGVGGDPQSGSMLEIANNGTDILVYHLFPGGSSLVGCANAQATTTNTDTITVNHQQLDDSDRVAIMDPKSFAPGATDEQVGGFPLADEIEIELSLGATGEDELRLLPGNPASHDDTFVLGRGGLNWNPSDLIDDVDVVTEEFPPISSYDVSLGSGDNTFTAQGGFGTGDPILNPMVITGGDVLGTDAITGGDGADEIDGHGAADVLRGGGGNDEVVGGGGRDRMLGNGGNDDLLAKDGKRDPRIDCGPGAADGAERDKNKDPKPKSC